MAIVIRREFINLELSDKDRVVDGQVAISCIIARICILLHFDLFLLVLVAQLLVFIQHESIFRFHLW